MIFGKEYKLLNDNNFSWLLYFRPRIGPNDLLSILFWNTQICVLPWISEIKFHTQNRKRNINLNSIALLSRLRDKLKDEQITWECVKEPNFAHIDTGKFQQNDSRITYSNKRPPFITQANIQSSNRRRIRGPIICFVEPLVRYQRFDHVCSSNIYIFFISSISREWTWKLMIIMRINRTLLAMLIGWCTHGGSIQHLSRLQQTVPIVTVYLTVVLRYKKMHHA